MCPALTIALTCGLATVLAVLEHDHRTCYFPSVGRADSFQETVPALKPCNIGIIGFVPSHDLARYINEVTLPANAAMAFEL